MSKLREHVVIVEGELTIPAEGDLSAYVVFTQLTPKGPHVYAGWLDAPDDEMALQFAREHYGQDQKCVCVWVVPRSAICGTEKDYPASSEEGQVRAWTVFSRKSTGDPYTAGGSIDAVSGVAALEAARQMLAADAPDGIWVVPRERIVSTEEDDVIWRTTDQTYRLARGYSAVVRSKWETIRAERDITDYEKDDLKECF